MEESVQVGRYQVQEVIGKGAMGVVYLAYDPQIGRRVALKTIRPAEGARPQEVAENRERFQREARAAGSLLHPNIVTIFDVFDDKGTLYIAMEYVQGRLLEDFCSKKTLLAPERAARLVMQGLAALQYAHKRGIVHRDIKPANLMVLEDEETLKVMDFGVAREAGAHLTQAGFVVGTPHYMSPEQIEGRPLDGRSDVFSMGVVLYELLAGERPFPGDSISTVIYRILNDRPAPLAEVSPRLPRALDHILAKALAKDPSQRFASAQAFQEALGEFLDTGTWEDQPLSAVEETFPSGEGILPPPPSAGIRRKRPGRLSRRIWAWAGLLIAAGAAALVVTALRQDRAGDPQGQAAGAGSEKLPRAISVVTDPPGASLFLDGQPVDAVTLAVDDRSLHVVEARLGCRYGRADLNGSHPVALLTIPLAPGPFRLPVDSVPPGASLFADGVDTGLKTPAELPREGCEAFQMELRLEGFLPHRAVVDPSTGAASLSVALEKEPEKGSLRVTGGSDKILIYEDTRLLGRPGQTLLLPAGEHVLRFVDPALRGSIERRVVVEAGATVSLRTPEFRTGRVFLYGKPVEDGKVAVDGEYFEDLPLIGSQPLAVGSHRFVVTASDGRKVAFTWNVQPGDQTRVVDFDAGRAQSP
ncbi:MAG: serine/threonine-protein kinase [Acidobacteriota bacterium]